MPTLSQTLTQEIQWKKLGQDDFPSWDVDDRWWIVSKTDVDGSGWIFLFMYPAYAMNENEARWWGEQTGCRSRERFVPVK